MATYIARAFGGELILQEPKDEPASVLLEFTWAEREKRSKLKKDRTRAMSKKGGNKKAKTHKEYRITQIPRMGVNCGIETIEQDWKKIK